MVTILVMPTSILACCNLKFSHIIVTQIVALLILDALFSRLNKVMLMWKFIKHSEVIVYIYLLCYINCGCFLGVMDEVPENIMA